MINKRRVKGLLLLGNGERISCRPVYPRIEVRLPGASAAASAAAAPAAGEPPSSAATAGTGRREGTCEGRLQSGEGVLAPASGVSVRAVPVDVGLLGQFRWGVEAGVVQYLRSDAERDGVDEEPVPQLEGDRRRLLHPGEVLQVATEGRPGSGDVGPGPGAFGGHPTRQHERGEEESSEEQSDRYRHGDRPRVVDRR